MKTIGLIGGMSWQSTVTYYQTINNTVNEVLGGLHSAKILLYSVDFAEIEQCQDNGDWDKSAEILSIVALKLERAGADFIVIGTNTMHKVASQIQANINLPIIHIADTTADILINDGITKVALLGTKYTMTEDFYINKLIEKGLDVIIPEDIDIETINDVIYNELCLGIKSNESRNSYICIIEKLKEKGLRE